MANRIQMLSPSAVLFSAYPGAIRYVDGCITKVREIVNREGDRSDALSAGVRRVIAARINAELAQVRTHMDARAQRSAANRGAAVPTSPSTDDDFLAAVLGNGTETATATATVPAAPPTVLGVRDVGLIHVNAEATVRTRVFPRSFHCQGCEHYLLINPARPPDSLRCPCCGVGMLVPEPIVSVCARCASMRELLPPGEQVGKYRRPRRLDAYIGSPADCPDCRQGHIHLRKHQTNSISRWEWGCQSCTSFRETVQDRCLDCAMPAGPNAQAQPSSVIFMQPLPASASSALMPLTDVQMFVQNAALDPVTIRDAAISDTNWPDAFTLESGIASGQLRQEDVSAFRESCILDAYLVNRIRVVTTVYGYKAGGAANHPISRVDDDDRLAHFFDDPEGIFRFLCYSMVSEGAALVLELDREAIISRLSQFSQSLKGVDYETALRAELSAIQSQPLRDLLRAEGEFLLLYRSLHAMEHALLTAAVQQIGNEILGSKLFLSAGTIVIYEREPVGRGGVVQLVNQGEGLRRLLAAARDLVLGCLQGCAEGCPTCTYVRDAHCTHALDEIQRSWLPPNSLLSRAGARVLLAPQES